MNIKNFSSFLLSIVVGVLISIYIFKQYDVLEAKTSNKFMFLQAGTYDKVDTIENDMIKIKNYIIEENDGVYNTYVGITASNSNFEKLKKYYNSLGLNITLKEKNIDNEIFNDYIIKYDAILEDTEEEKVITLISNKVITKYKDLFNGQN